MVLQHKNNVFLCAYLGSR